MPTDAFLKQWYQQYDVLGEREPYYQSLAGDNPWATTEGMEIAFQFGLVKHMLKPHTSPPKADPPPTENLKLLDVGSGPGLFLDLVKRAGWDGVGIELHGAAAKASQERFGITVHAGTIESVVLPEASFDAVTLWDIFEHVRDPLGLLARVHALLQSGGYIFIETPNVRSLLDSIVVGFAKFGIRGPAKTFYGLHHLTLWHPSVIQSTLEKNGFVVQRIRFARTPPSRIFRKNTPRDFLMRVGIGLIQWFGRLIGRQNKMIIVARKQ